jgi:hypothetical protein
MARNLSPGHGHLSITGFGGQLVVDMGSSVLVGNPGPVKRPIRGTLIEGLKFGIMASVLVSAHLGPPQLFCMRC